jgi:Tfp pilus assembly protein PilO
MLRSSKISLPWSVAASHWRNRKLVLRAALGVLAAANLIAAGMILFPPGGSAEELRQQLTSLQSQIQSRQVVLERTRQHASAVEKGRAEGDDFLNEYFLPSRSHMSSLLTELEAAASKSKIKPREHAYAVEPVEGSDTLSMMTITAAYEGTYTDLMQFVHEVDRSPRLLIIESLNAAPQQGSGLLSVAIKMETFVRDDGTDSGMQDAKSEGNPVAAALPAKMGDKP